jgi:hypothetical protein
MLLITYAELNPLKTELPSKNARLECFIFPMIIRFTRKRYRTLQLNGRKVCIYSSWTMGLISVGCSSREQEKISTHNK